jgi:hypothetical protein
MTDPLLALSVVLRLPPTVEETVGQFNNTLEGPPNGFRFDARHLPHITLVQQFSPSDEITSISEAIRPIATNHPPIRLATADLRCGGTATVLTLAANRTLGTLHRRLMDQLAEFDMGAGNENAFADANAGFVNVEPARARDVAWVTRFRTEAAYDVFDPHITLGLGVLDASAPSIAFEASVIALCTLGRFCTCRQVLMSWKLRTG